MWNWKYLLVIRNYLFPKLSFLYKCRLFFFCTDIHLGFFLHPVLDSPRLMQLLIFSPVFWARVHQPFPKTFFVFFSRFCEFECNTTSVMRTVGNARPCDKKPVFAWKNLLPWNFVTSFPNDKILAFTKWKAFADDTFNVA